MGSSILAPERRESHQPAPLVPRFLRGALCGVPGLDFTCTALRLPSRTVVRARPGSRSPRSPGSRDGTNGGAVQVSPVSISSPNGETMTFRTHHALLLECNGWGVGWYPMQLRDTAPGMLSGARSIWASWRSLWERVVISARVVT
jgi:hypothetical protein